MDDRKPNITSLRIQEASDIIYNRYLEIFHRPGNEKLKETYNNLISETITAIIDEFHLQYLERFLDSEEISKDSANLHYPLYKNLRIWLRMQMVSGVQLVIIRREQEGEKLEKVGVGPKQQIIEYVAARFWDLRMEEVLDDLNQQLVKKDTDQAAEAIKRNVPGIDAVSDGFLKHYTGRLLWSTVYGVLLAGWKDTKN